MATAALQAQRLFLTASTSSSSSFTTLPRRTTVPCRAGLRVPSNVQTTTTASSNPDDGGLGAGLKLDWIDVTSTIPSPSDRTNTTAVDKLRLVAEAAADRAEMHDIIGRQRDNWNHLLLHATNSLTLAASVMAALAPSASAAPGAVAGSAGVLLATAAVTMAAVNKVQPSQLAEEQRNATRLWRQLERGVRATLDDHQQGQNAVTEGDVQDAMDRVLALDAAYPLPLLPGMLEKFPKAVEPARWWPRRRPQTQSPKATTRSRSFGARRGVVTTPTPSNGNGWSQDLEDELRGLLRVLRAKDEHQYLKVGKLILGVNRSLAVAGPALAGTAAVAAAFSGTGNSWASGAAVACGALAAAANTVEHGGQLGMLFELLRNCAGFYRKLQEDIEAALAENDVERRENGDVFRTKVALLLGRDVAELRQFRRFAAAAVKEKDIKEYAGKLF